MKTLFLKASFLLSPVILMGLIFLIQDPMKIIYQVDSPVSPGVLMNDRLFQARYLEQRKYEYTSFIFGSSRSKAFKTSEWKKYLPAETKLFHMGVNDETLYGLSRKLQYLSKLGYNVDHALILVDHRLLSLKTDHEAHIFREYYKTTGESASSYYQRFLIAFLDPNFLSAYVFWKINGTVDKEESVYLWDPGFEYEPVTGDHYYRRMEHEIGSNPEVYYDKKLNPVFYERKPKTSPNLIDSRSRELLLEIKQVLDKKRTDFKVIVTPNYDQIKLSDGDLDHLKLVFGGNHVFDFSGVNDLTNNYRDFYEHKHFRPHIADRVLERAYSEK